MFLNLTYGKIHTEFIAMFLICFHEQSQSLTSSNGEVNKDLTGSECSSQHSK